MRYLNLPPPLPPSPKVPLGLLWKRTRNRILIDHLHSGCVASVIRMYYFFELNALSDNTWVSVQLMSWACAEPGIIFVCACLPALWPLIRKSLSLRSRPSKNTAGGSGDAYWEQNTAHGPQVWSEHAHGKSLFRSNHDFISLGDMGSDQEYGNPASGASASYTHDGAPGPSAGAGIIVQHEITQESESAMNRLDDHMKPSLGVYQ